MIRSDDDGVTWRGILEVHETIEEGQAGCREGVGRGVLIDFVDGQRGWVPTNLGRSLYRTTDGGVTWQFLPQEALGSVDFTTPRDGWGVGRVAPGVKAIVATTDGGQTWRQRTPSPATPTMSFSRPVFADRATGWVSWSDYPAYGIFHTDDGGRTWNTEFELPDGPSVTMVGMDRVTNSAWASTNRGALMRRRIGPPPTTVRAHGKATRTWGQVKRRRGR